jgi:hypothetical protein
MRIAIIDGMNQDVGLKILFPEADYFINTIEFDRTESFAKYNIIPKYDWTIINDKNYDYLFIIIALCDIKTNSTIYEFLKREDEIINNNNFKKVFIFDNYDFDYDPNELWNNEKITLFFKRNYNKNKIYKKNVVPFPFIMFGHVSLIEKCDTEMVSKEKYFENKLNRVFFTGTLFTYQNEEYGVSRNRDAIYRKICHTIYNPGYLSYNNFIDTLRNSRFGLDLLGVGEPNKRTFEILLSGSLMLSEKNNLKWPFDEEFCEKTIFSDEHEYLNNLVLFLENPELYNSCLEKQYDIVNKYFNVKWIREHIELYMFSV